MRIRKTTVLWVFAVSAAFITGWALSPGPYRHFYSTSQKIELLGDQGTVIGVLPTDTPMVSDVELKDSLDLGWWAYVPVQFDTMASAQELGVRGHGKPRSIATLTLRANSFPGEAQLSPESRPDASKAF